MKKKNVISEKRRKEIMDAFEKSLEESLDEKEDKIVKKASNKPNTDETEKEIQEHIAKEVRRILNEKKKPNNIPSKTKLVQKSNISKKPKKKISKPKTNKYYRYTVPKERGICSRIINRMMYECEDYNDIEDYLYDNYGYIHGDLEQSRTSKTRRGQRLYKRVQAYEDAREDIAMKKTFTTIKVAAVVGMLAATGFAGKFLIDQVNDIVNSGYVAQEKEKPTLENANEGQILYAENRLDKIDYDFKYLTRTDLLDAIIRSGSKVSGITESRARAACKDYLNFSDQKLLEDILKESYEGDYAFFTEEKKMELNQLLYEMLDEDVKKWIRNPEKVAEIKARDAEKSNSEMEIG